MLCNVKNVVYYPYRTAFAEDRLFIIPREWVSSLETALCKEAHVHQDNHTTFVFDWDEGVSSLRFGDLNLLNQPIVVTFHDFVAIFGVKLLVKDW